jgi:hypothetical protein
MVCFLTLILKKLKSCHYTELEQALFPDVFLISVVAEHRSLSSLIYLNPNLQVDANQEEEDDESTLNSRSINPFNRKQMAGFLAWPEYKHCNGFVRFNQSNG